VGTTESLTLHTSDGLALEAELVIPDEPIGAAVLTHPHPRHGGNMRSMVPGELIHELPARNIATLRFNFRGMGNSQGSFDDGDGERRDVIAAVDTLHELVEGLPLIVCGSSFGADTALSVDDDRITAWCGLAPPLREEKLSLMKTVAADERPKRLIIAERDQYRVPENVQEVIASWQNTSMDIVPGADHFFVGRLHIAIEMCCNFVMSFTNR
jgi:alpha/beta superfamily hydrolase